MAINEAELVIEQSFFLPNDVIEGYDVIDTSPSREIDPIEYFNGIGSYIKSERYKVISEDDTHIHSIIDEVSVMVYRLLYKLKYSK